MKRILKNLAIIPARIGSKRIKKKNLRKLNNKPIISYTIEAALKSRLFDKIHVSTDSDEIANIAVDYGAKIILRPKELAQDESPEFLSWKHAINFLFNQGLYFDNFISLPPTSPLRSLRDTEVCLNELKSKEEIVITVTPSNRNPWFNMVNLDSEKYASKILSGESINRRQDAPESFDITTIAYVAKTDFILNFSSIWEGKVRGVIIPKERALDIDDKYDFSIAQHLIKFRKDLIFDKNYLK